LVALSRRLILVALLRQLISFETVDLGCSFATVDLVALSFPCVVRQANSAGRREIQRHSSTGVARDNDGGNGPLH